MTAARATTVDDGSSQSREPRRTHIRLDVEGLRALAILSVLAYHAGLTFFPGGFVGVDIFFVISGFLITSLLVREADRTGRISLSSFYARRAKRLLPAATVVLAACAVGTAVLFNGSEARVFGGDIVAAAANLVNWRFAARSVDYLAEDTGESPVLHFWSLAVEEQFYIVWPLLVLLALFIARRFGRSIRSTMGVGLAMVGVASFAASIVLSDSDPARAFFVTTTRMWELAVGAGVALALPMLGRLSVRVASLLAFAGVTAIVASMFVLNDGMAWPGAAAALPVLGTAAVIAAGVSRADTVAGRALSIKPLVWIGGLSYSLYLWHWPLLVFAEQYRGHLGVKGAVMISAAAVIPAYLSQRLVENPIRFSRRRFADRGRVLLLGALLILMGVTAGLAVVAASPRTELPAASADGDAGRPLGAMALGDDPSNSPAGAPGAPVTSIYPAPADAPDDVPSAYDEGCQAMASATEPTYCAAGDPNGEVQILAVGDSKLFQYFDVLDLIGRERGWSFTFATKSACSWIAGTPLIDGRPYTECRDFGSAVSERMEVEVPDVVLTSGGLFNLAGQDSTSHEDRARVLSEQWAHAISLGAQVISLQENPHPPADPQVYECVESNGEDLEQCAFSRDSGTRNSLGPAQELAVMEVEGARLVTLTDYICPQDQCAAVIGETLIYRQGSHITNTYALSMADILGERLAAVIDDREPEASSSPAD